jgi:hypothetical protein
MLAIVLTVSAQEQNKEVVIKKMGMMKANPAALAPKFTPEQQKQMAEFRLNMQKEMLQIDNQLNEKKAQLKTLEQVEKPNLKSIYSKIDEISALQNQEMKAMAAHKNSVRSILTEEQRVQFDLRANRPMRTNKQMRAKRPMRANEPSKCCKMEMGKKPMMIMEHGQKMKMEKPAKPNMEKEVKN